MPISHRTETWSSNDNSSPVVEMTNGLIWLIKFNVYNSLHIDGSFELGYFLNSLIQPIDIFGWDRASTQYTH